MDYDTHAATTRSQQSFNALLIYIFWICICVWCVWYMCAHVYTCVMHMDAWRGQRLMPGVFSNCSPRHFLWQGLLLNPKFNDSASPASLLATGSQCLSLILKCWRYRQPAMPSWFFTWVLSRLCSSCSCGMLYPRSLLPRPHAMFGFPSYSKS